MTAALDSCTGERAARGDKMPTPSDSAVSLASFMLEVASVQGPNTPLDGYPGGSPAAEQTQLKMMQYDCEQDGLHTSLIAEASQLVISHWDQARVRNAR